MKKKRFFQFGGFSVPCSTVRFRRRSFPGDKKEVWIENSGTSIVNSKPNGVRTIIGGLDCSVCFW